MANRDWYDFKELLDNEIEWPSSYTFKFIVPKFEIEKVVALFESGEVRQKESRHGNYISLTAVSMVNSSEELISTYKRASEIPGILSL
jgi:uncharacterized protein